MPHKRCKGCGESKPLDAFYRHPGAKDGHRGKCKTCHVAATTANAKADPERYNELKRLAAHRYPARVRQQRREWEARNRRQLAEKTKAIRAKYPEKARARTAVMEALRSGELSRPEQCERCGRPGKPTADGRASIQAHHHDYSKPLDVEWLCQGCHFAHHHPEKERLNA